MAPQSKVELFAAIRRDSRTEGLGARALARKYEVHRRLVREALTSAWHADPTEDQMAHPNEDLMREAFAAFGRGDIEALQHQYFAADIRWHTPGRSPLHGDYEGVAQVIESFARLFELTGDTYRAELHDVIANEEHAVALYTEHAVRTGRQLEDRAVLVSHIHNGKVSEVWIHPADLYAVDEFLS